MRTDLLQQGFGRSLTRPPLLSVPPAAKRHFDEGVDPNKLGGGDPRLPKSRIGASHITVVPGESIQEAIDETHNRGGGVVFLEVGTYYPGSSLNLPGGVAIEGAGNFNTIIDFEGGAYSLNIVGSDPYTTGTVDVTADSTTVTGTLTVWTASMAGQGILIDGDWYYIASVESNTSLTLTYAFSGSTQTGLAYTIATVNTGARVDRMTIQNSSANLINLQYFYGTELSNIVVATGANGIDAQDGVFFILDNADISDCVNGLYTDNIYSYPFKSFFIYNCSGNGWQSDSGGDASTYDFGISNCGGVGLKLTSTNKVSFTSFTIDSHVSHGVELVSGCDSNTFTSGVVNINGGDGIKLTASSDKNTICQVECSSNTGYGVNIANAGCDNNLLGQDVLVSNGSGQINNSGTGTKLRGCVGSADI